LSTHPGYKGQNLPRSQLPE